MPEDRYRKGLEIRREVVGPDTIDQWFEDADEFTRPLEELTTEIGWGTIWARPGLDRKTRSLITLALLTAQDNEDALTTHLRNAVRNGCTHEEIREALLHTIAYCGLPRARSAVKLASRVLGSSSDSD